MYNLIDDQIIDNIDASIYWKNLEGKYLGCNNFMPNMIHLKRADILGKTDFTLPWKAYANDIRKRDLFVMETRKKHTIEEVIFVNGAKREFLSSKSPLFDRQDNVIGIIGVSIDITEYKSLESKGYGMIFLSAA